MANSDALYVYTLETVNMLINASEIQKETSTDADFVKIVEALEKGKCLEKIGLYEFALSNGILLRKDRIIIPEVFRSRIFKELHSGPTS